MASLGGAFARSIDNVIDLFERGLGSAQLIAGKLNREGDVKGWEALQPLVGSMQRGCNEITKHYQTLTGLGEPFVTGDVAGIEEIHHVIHQLELEVIHPLKAAGRSGASIDPVYLQERADEHQDNTIAQIGWLIRRMQVASQPPPLRAKNSARRLQMARQELVYNTSKSSAVDLRMASPPPSAPLPLPPRRPVNLAERRNDSQRTQSFHTAPRPSTSGSIGMRNRESNEQRLSLVREGLQQRDRAPVPHTAASEYLGFQTNPFGDEIEAAIDDSLPELLRSLSVDLMMPAPLQITASEGNRDSYQDELLSRTSSNRSVLPNSVYSKHPASSHGERSPKSEHGLSSSPDSMRSLYDGLLPVSFEYPGDLAKEAAAVQASMNAPSRIEHVALQARGRNRASTIGMTVFPAPPLARVDSNSRPAPPPSAPLPRLPGPRRALAPGKPQPVPAPQSDGSKAPASAISESRPSPPALTEQAIMPQGVRRASEKHYALPERPNNAARTSSSMGSVSSNDSRTSWSTNLTTDSDSTKKSWRSIFDSKQAKPDKAHGWCRGAWELQHASADAAANAKTLPYAERRRPADAVGGMWSKNTMFSYIKCKSCAFEGKAVRNPATGKHEPDADVYEADGILYRWELLYRSHVPVATALPNPADSSFACIFCFHQGERRVVLKGVKAFVDHLQTHRQARPKDEAIACARALVDRGASATEKFAVALPPAFF